MSQEKQATSLSDGQTQPAAVHVGGTSTTTEAEPKEATSIDGKDMEDVVHQEEVNKKIIDVKAPRSEENGLVTQPGAVRVGGKEEATSKEDVLNEMKKQDQALQEQFISGGIGPQHLHLHDIPLPQPMPLPGDLEMDRAVRASRSACPGAHADYGSVPFHVASHHPYTGSNSGASLANNSVAPSNSSVRMGRTGTVSHDHEDLTEFSRSTLTIANPVEENPLNRDLEEATPVESLEAERQEQRKLITLAEHKHKLAIACLLTLVIFLAALGVSMLVVFVLGTEEGAYDDGLLSPPPPMPHAPSTPQEFLLDALPTNLIQALESVGEQQQSPQQDAFDWLAADPNLQNYSSSQASQRYVLAVLYYSTQGRLWKENEHWLSYDHHECDWHAKKDYTAYPVSEHAESPCNNETMVYERLWLPGNRLNGTLPEELYALMDLKSIDLFSNLALQGTISTQIGVLTNMDKLSFMMTGLTGTLPSEIGHLSDLSILYLASGDHFPLTLSGTIPREIYQLTKLQQLMMNSHRFSGTISTEIGLLTNLVTLLLQVNQFSGSVPTEIGRLSLLRQAYLFDNALTGTIPTELALLPWLGDLHLNSNQLTGTIPSSLGSASSLKELVLANNHLEGTVPSELAQLTDMYVLFLSYNEGLTGMLASQFGQLTKLAAFDVTNTGITGVLPEPLQAAQEGIDFDRYNGECLRRIPCQSEHLPSAEIEYEVP